MFAALVACCVLGSPHPNIILIYSDDHARQAISAYGSPYIKTPNIDRIANEGIQFNRHYSTNPLCAPSRAAVLTGKYSHINGHKDNSTTFDGSQQTFPKLLEKAGYETAFIGKWHLVSNPQGFDYWDVLPGQGVYYSPQFLSQKGKETVPGYVTEIITDKALNWLKEPRQKPFFLMIGHKAPHRNWLPNVKRLHMFEDTVFPEPPTLRTDYSTLASAAKNAQMRIDANMQTLYDLQLDHVPNGLSEEEAQAWKEGFAKQDIAYKDQLAKTGDLLGTNFQRYLKNYLRCIVDVDISVGQILDYLDKTGLSKNTIVMYSSDQGFFVGENAWYDKRFFYEPSAGTPLLVRVPWMKHRVENHLTEDTDFAPTILDFAGVNPPVDMQGESLFSSTPHQVVYGHFYESNDADHKVAKYVAATTAQHKVICYYELGEWELFDLAKDPNETANLWSSPEKSGTRSEMIRKLLAEMRRLKEDPDLIERVTALRQP